MTRKAKRVVLALGTIVVGVPATMWGLDAYGRAHASAEGRFDALVVPGARVWRGGVPSKALRRRVQRAAELFHAGHAPRLVLTGGPRGARPPEARVAARVAMEKGVPGSAIVLEDASRDTEQNAKFTRELIGDLRVLVVTDAYHVLRCELIFERYFSEAELVGVPLGKRPPIGATFREVGALLFYLVTLPF